MEEKGSSFNPEFVPLWLRIHCPAKMYFLEGDLWWRIQGRKLCFNLNKDYVGKSISEVPF